MKAGFACFSVTMVHRCAAVYPELSLAKLEEAHHRVTTVGGRRLAKLAGLGIIGMKFRLQSKNDSITAVCSQRKN